MLILLAVAVLVSALLVLGLDGLLPFGPLLAFSVDSDDDEEAGRSVAFNPHNLGLAAAMLGALAWFSLGYLDLTCRRSWYSQGF